MVEVIHEHETTTNDSGVGMGMIFGIILAVAVVLFLFYYFGRGLLSGGGYTQPQINIPDKVNVNIQQQKPSGK